MSTIIDKSQDDEMNVDLRTSVFDNEALSVERYAVVHTHTHSRLWPNPPRTSFVLSFVPVLKTFP